MSFETAIGIAALAGVGMIILGAILLGLFPNFDGFGTKARSEAAHTDAGNSSVLEIIAKVVGVFLTVVKDIVTGKAGRFHIGQILIAVGFLVFLGCGLIWLGAKASGGSRSSSSGTGTSTGT
jgi:hypothetical protein